MEEIQDFDGTTRYKLDRRLSHQHLSRPNKSFIDCHKRVGSWKSRLNFSQKTNGLVYSAKDRLQMIPIT